MTKSIFMTAVSVCLLNVALLPGQEIAKTEHNKHPSINKSKWQNVSLPFRPINITAINNNLWICGLNETIAVSNDGGASWKVQHQKQDGEVLLNIAFSDEKTGHAAGTGGLILSTTDSGQTWTAHRGGPTIQSFSFAGAAAGIAEVDGHVSLTADGGAHWQEVVAMHTDPKVQPFSEVESVAALNPTHFAIALHQPEGENIVLSTVDAGKNWTPLHIANTFAGTLIPHDSEYGAFGIEYLGREHDPSGGYSAPVALHSQDGLNWKHGIRASTEFDGCTAQGCSLHYGVLEVLYGNTEKIWSLPQDLSLSRKWAMVGDNVCMVDSGLKCGKAIPSEIPQPMPDNGPINIQVGPEKPFVEECLDCHFSQLPFPKNLARRPAAIKSATVTFMVRRDGSVSNIEIKGIPIQAMAEEIAHQISGWLIAPAHQGLDTVAAHKQIDMSILCFPGFPGAPNSASCTVYPANTFTNLR